MSRHFLKVDLKFATLVMTVGIIFLWLSLAPLWLFLSCKNDAKDSNVENILIPQWAQGAEEVFSPLLFMVNPKEHRWTENTKDQYKWLWLIPTCFIGFVVPGVLLLLLLISLESYSLIWLIQKVIYDMVLFIYLMIGSLLLWIGCLF